MSNTRLLTTRSPLGLVLPLLAFLALWLALAPAGRAEVLKPAVNLGPVTVLNGVATVTGSLHGVDPNGATVTVNGQPLGLNLNGTFAGVVNVSGQSALELKVANPRTGEQSTVSIPLNTNVVGPGGIIPSDVLAAIERAAVSILEPLGGFAILDGQPLTIEGSVGNEDELASLKVNGVDALDSLDALGNFAVPIPGTSKTVTVTVTDSRGVSTSTTYPVTHTTSPESRTTTAAQAVGLKVASVRYVTKSFRRTKRVQMIVTIKDSLGRLVQGATVQVQAAPAKRLRLKPRVKRTGKAGGVSFLLHPRAAIFGKRLFTVVVAKTPTASAQRKTSVRVPKLRARTTTRKKG